MSIKIIRTDSNHPSFIQLVGLLNQELNKRYGAIQSEYDQYNIFDDPVEVVLAEFNAEVVGCGAFRKMDNTNWAEIKRMFVKPEFRGKGISKAIVKALEEWTSELKFEACVLETGKRLHEALNLYQKLGYQQIENYGPYKDLPHSICMKKNLF